MYINAPVQWDAEVQTIRDIVLNVMPRVDIHPIYNRRYWSKLEGNATPSKLQGIMNSIVTGFDIGEITFAEPAEKPECDHEVLDGSNRMDAIKKYYNNEFSIHTSCPHSAFAGKYFKDLSAEAQEAILSYRVRLVWYRNVTNEIKGMLFRLRNGGTPVNAMEMLNAYGRIPIADAVRSTAREIPDETTKPHAIFESEYDKKNDKVEWEHLDFPNARLFHDELVARITYIMYHKGTLVACDHKDQLQVMYKDKSLTEPRVAEIMKKVNQCLDFLLIIAKACKARTGRGLESHEFTMLYRWYVDFLSKRGLDASSLKIVDSTKFWDEFSFAITSIMSKDKSLHPKSLASGTVNGKSICGPKNAFASGCSQHSSVRRIQQTVDWLVNDAGFEPLDNECIKIIDRRETFSFKDIEQKWIAQGYRCWVSGEPLSREDARGAHIKARSLGGVTDPVTNMAVVHVEHNRAMGTMNAEEYREVWLRKNAA